MRGAWGQDTWVATADGPPSLFFLILGEVVKDYLFVLPEIWESSLVGTSGSFLLWGKVISYDSVYFVV